MRRIINEQMKFGEVSIEDIEIDISSRDEIPKTLIGLQEIYCNAAIREKVFTLLEELIEPGVDINNGRPGMDLWKILVLGCVRLNCNCDYDKIHEMANQHNTIRMMLGHSSLDMKYSYRLQTLKDNISLFTPEILDKINQVVVNFGINRFSKKKLKK